MSTSRTLEGEKVAEIVEISYAPESDALLGFSLDIPSVSSFTDTYTLQLAGWVIGCDRPVKEVAVACDDQVLRCCPVELPRSDVSSVHGPAGAQSGFDTAVGLASLPRAGRLRIDALLDDGTQQPMIEIGYRRAPLNSGFSPEFQPLMITSLFRMGTTRLLRLLSEHPEILVERSYPYETYAASYWLQAFKILTEPANLHESSHPDDFVERRRWIGHNPFHRKPVTEHAAVAKWMGHGSIERVAEFCQRATQDFYRTVAAAQNEGSPRFFAEKHLPSSHVPWMIHDLYHGAREIFLVRDFRDVVCSMLAFNNKRGFAAFDRQKVDTDLEMIELFAIRCAQLSAAWRQREESALLVRYEELVLDPTATMGALLRHAGLDDRERTVNSLIAAADCETSELAFHRTTRSPEESIGRWRHELTPEVATTVNRLLEDSLVAFGYEPAVATPGRC